MAALSQVHSRCSQVFLDSVRRARTEQMERAHWESQEVMQMLKLTPDLPSTALLLLQFSSAHPRRLHPFRCVVQPGSQRYFSPTLTPHPPGHPTGSAFNLYESDQVALGFPCGSVVKNLPANAGDAGSIPEWGRSPGEGNGNPLQCSFLGNPMDRGAWRATVHDCKESDATKQLNNSNTAPPPALHPHHPAWLTAEASLGPLPPPLLPSLFLPLRGQSSL